MERQAPTSEDMPAAEDAVTSAILNGYLPPRPTDAMTDADLDQLLGQASPVPVDVAGLMARLEQGSDRPLPSGRVTTHSMRLLPALGKWASAALFLVLLGWGFEQVSTQADPDTIGGRSVDEWRVDFPPPAYVGTPALGVPGITDRLGNPVPAAPPQLSLHVPDQARSNVALGKRVTSSAPLPIEGELGFVTDGIRSGDAVVTLESGMQWVQVDLAASHEIYGIVVWHDYSTATAYSDVVVAICDDPDFQSAVTVAFNNSRQGYPQYGIDAGNDAIYLETNYGRVIDTNGLRGRYVRLYSNGCSQDLANRYTEVEVYGREFR